MKSTTKVENSSHMVLIVIFPIKSIWTRNDHKKRWIPQNSFSEAEFRQEDFAMIKYFTSQSRTLWFTQHIACTRAILKGNDQEEIEPVGAYILSGTEVKRVSEGEATVVFKIVEEVDGVDALARYWTDFDPRTLR
ncbi:uncharacterized protein BDW43DRAFT_317260 [Aspergillus alliaceus]|uniref:uncharacterized protein n=1 Tax=Petromyces alliaceus TaxID=209559 RepID=UPI0012A481A7|nr:uncharacterized protein BDW43DRAFT_317260 [Aspergillus alliaceus]KAB8226974.1 hypothetical protein BDW43DRAFT_317260 [Aspergillus alliaceus]